MVSNPKAFQSRLTFILISTHSSSNTCFKYILILQSTTSEYHQIPSLSTRHLNEAFSWLTTRTHGKRFGKFLEIHLGVLSLPKSMANGSDETFLNYWTTVGLFLPQYFEGVIQNILWNNRFNSAKSHREKSCCSTWLSRIGFKLTSPKSSQWDFYR